MSKSIQFKIGHAEHDNKKTGLTVFLFGKRVPCAYHLCGTAPATREVSVIESSSPYIDAIMFSGSSAFGLNAAGGVMKYLFEQGQGVKTPSGPVPIVPAACIYDLEYSNNTLTTEKMAYQACQNAIEAGQQKTGLVGAGIGATVGKALSHTQAMAGGFGYISIKQDKLEVTASVVVNAFGDIIDPKLKLIAAGKDKEGNMESATNALLSGTTLSKKFSNTTLLLITTNAKLNPFELKCLAKMAVSGMARSISPAFTCYDGDSIFAVSTEEIEADSVSAGTLAAEATAQAIRQAVQYHDG